MGRGCLVQIAENERLLWEEDDECLASLQEEINRSNNDIFSNLNTLWELTEY